MYSNAIIIREGQVTISKTIRDKPQADTIMFEVVDEQVHIIPITNVTGALSEHGNLEKKDFSAIRDLVWKE